MSLSRSSRQYMGVRAILPPDLQSATRNPTTTDTAYVKGTLWLNTSSPASFMYSGSSGVWISLGTSASGDVTSLTGSSGGAIAPVAGNISLLGTANQITTTGTPGTITWSLPAAIVAPGSLTTTTSLTATLGAITATNGNLVLTAAGNKMVRSSVGTTTAAGANSIGSVTLVGGTATVSTTAVTAGSLIQLWRQSIGATGAAAIGGLVIGTITAGTSFVINAVQAASATSLQASDVSIVGWEIIN